MNMSKTTNNNDSVEMPRVSHTSQDTEGYSLPFQEKFLRDYSNRMGHNVKATFVITETASKSEQRKIFNAAMTYVKQNDIKNITVEKVDRLVRNFRDTVMIDDWLEEDADRKVHFVKDSLVLHKNSRSQEKLNWGIRVVIAKNYIDNLKEEVEKGVKEKIAQGWLPGTPPLGYKTIGDEGHKIHVIDDDVAPLIQKLFSLYLEPSHSISTVTAEMVRLGLRTRKGRPLVRTHIRKLLAHKFYIGKLPWVGNVYKGMQDPIITNEVFEAVQNKLEAKNSPKYFKHSSLLKGLMRCEECGRMITWESHKGVYYGRCKGYRRDCSHKKYAKLPEVELQLLAGFDLLKAPSNELAMWVREYIRERHESDMDAYYTSIRQLKQRHEDLARRIDIAYDDKADERITAEMFDSKAAKWRGEQEAILNQLSKFDATYAAKLEHDLNILELSQRAAEIFSTKKDIEQRRALIGEIYSNLTLNGQFLTYEYTEHAQAIAKKAATSNVLKEEFELTKNASTEAKNEYENNQKTLWLASYPSGGTKSTQVCFSWQNDWKR